MTRETLNVRIQPIYKEAIKRQAKEMIRSEGFVVETALFEMLKHKIGNANYPGKKMDGDNE